MQLGTTAERGVAQENPKNMLGPLAELSGGGFANSPDVPAKATGSIDCLQNAGMRASGG
jgi:hypothetical protein